jgi:hypothetical protein
MSTITIDQLHTTVESFSRCQLQFLSENCIVAMETSKHKPSCTLTVTGSSQITYTLQWTTGISLAGYKEPVKFTEHGAEAIAFLLAQKRTRFKVLEEALIGTGFDYWLGYPSTHPKYDPKNFLRARLEVSGILEETGSNTLAKRIAQKKKQVSVTDDLKLPAYIAITEFSTPQAYFGKK